MLEIVQSFVACRPSRLAQRAAADSTDHIWGGAPALALRAAPARAARPGAAAKGAGGAVQLRQWQAGKASLAGGCAGRRAAWTGVRSSYCRGLGCLFLIKNCNSVSTRVLPL